jgi:hypothetical protein
VEYLVVSLVALLASALTLFSGFGLGTLLLPAFLLFFPAELSVAMTAVVHLLNNLFKLVLLGRWAEWPVVLRFGLPAIAASFAGAWVLVTASEMSPLYVYNLLGRERTVLPVTVLMGLLIIGFAVLEMRPPRDHPGRERRGLVMGGLLSGFFGGLSGHQGALRSAFLLRAGLAKEAFIATGVVISCLVDLSRIGVYAEHLVGAASQLPWGLMAVAAVAAFLGAVAGRRAMGRVTMQGVRRLVAVLLALVGAGVAAGLL